jgi:hypothetical protein
MPRRLAALVVAVAAAIVPTVSAITADASVPPSTGTLTLISTPDDPYGGGRAVTAGLIAESNTADPLLLTYRRLDGSGDPLTDDPWWVLRFSAPAGLAAGSDYALTGSTDDVLQLAGATQYQRDYCPDLNGSVTIDEVSTDVDGLATALSATFVVHCTPKDSLYGAVGFNTTTPPLPSDATALVQAEARYPTLTSVFDGLTAELLAVDVGRHSLMLRWDTPGGFTCADVSLSRNEGGRVVATYVGSDDTLKVAGLDPTVRHQVAVAMSGSTPCVDGATVDRSVPVNPVVATIHRPRVERETSVVSVRGRIDVVTSGPTEPARFVDVEVRSRGVQGTVKVRARVTTDSDGRFIAHFPRRGASRVWVRVQPDKEPTAPDAVTDFWYHFGTASERESLP